MPGHEFQDLITSGWTATGTRPETITGGIKDIGLAHRMQAPAGSGRAMKGAASLKATGRVTGAGLSTITGGTATVIAISAAIGIRNTSRIGQLDNLGLEQQP